MKIYGRLDCPSALRAIAVGGYVASRVFFADEPTAAAERALALTSPPGIPAGRYQPSDPLLAFLESL